LKVARLIRDTFVIGKSDAGSLSSCGYGRMRCWLSVFCRSVARGRGTVFTQIGISLHLSLLWMHQPACIKTADTENRVAHIRTTQHIVCEGA
jgi:hypothetical protein